MTDEQMGSHVLAAILKGNLINVEFGNHPDKAPEDSEECSPAVLVSWAPNAAEQVGALVKAVVKLEFQAVLLGYK